MARYLFTSVPSKHQKYYTEEQRKRIIDLLNAQIEQPVFVCEIDPEIDLLSPYFRATEYPYFAGGTKHFSLAVEKAKKFLWFRYKSASLVGQIEWEFEGPDFKKISLKFYRKMDDFKTQIEQLRSTLTNQLNCEVVVAE